MTLTNRLSQLFSGCAALIACATFAAPAHAGPVELFRNTQQNPTAPDQLVAAYIYGGGGLFVSNDGGKSFGLMCSGAQNPKLKFEREINEFVMSGTGDIYIGLFNGLWRGQSNGCGFAEVPELSGNIIGAVAVDPIDPKRVYVGTSNGYTADNMPRANNLWLNDGTSNTFKPVGTENLIWFSTLHVVKQGTGRRIYATGVVSKLVKDAMDQLTSEVHYYVRVSEDEGKTWTDHEYDVNQFGPMHRTSDFRIVAIDPSNPDVVLGAVARDATTPDTFVYSTMQGKPGTWKQIGEVGELHAAAFGPDGKLYFGDDDQNSRSFYVVDKLGETPRKLSDTWKVGCLQWDPGKNRMLACKDWQFGTVDLATGQFSSILDMRCAESFVQCPDQATVKKACEAQLLQDYCLVSHYPVAPLCEGYDQGADAPSFIAAQEYTCKGGQVVPKPDNAAEGGAPAAAGTGAAGTSPAAAGTVATAGGSSGSGTKPVAAGGAGATTGSSTQGGSKSSGGCSVTRTERASTPWLTASLVALGWLVLRRRRAARRA